MDNVKTIKIFVKKDNNIEIDNIFSIVVVHSIFVVKIFEDMVNKGNVMDIIERNHVLVVNVVVVSIVFKKVQKRFVTVKNKTQALSENVFDFKKVVLKD